MNRLSARPLRLPLHAGRRCVASLAGWMLWLVLIAPVCGQTASALTEPAVCSHCPPSCQTIPRPQDQVWVVSTREMPDLNCGEPVSSRQMRLLRFDVQQGWIPSSMENFVAAAQPDQVTVIDVHGNRYNFEESLEAGWYVYNALICRAPETPLRFVIWSWPSDQLAKLLRDFRLKAERTNSEGFYLGWFLSQFDPYARVSLIGYSFGARVMTGGAHVLGGGRLEGHALPPRAGVPLRIRAALLVAALPNYWLLPGQYHGQAINQIDSMLVLYNPRDSVLRRYHLVEPLRPKALGVTGLLGVTALADAALRIDQRDVSSIIGRSHDLSRYFDSPYVMSELQRFLLWMPSDRAVPLP